MPDVFWCEYAWLGGDVPAAGVTVTVEGGVFTGLETGVPCGADVVRLPGLTVPGLANVHSHAFQRAMDDPAVLKAIERAGMERYYMAGEEYMKWVRRVAEEERKAVARLGLNK